MNEIIEKIKKLRELSKDNKNVNEAATAAALADKLIAKHRIEEAQLEIDSDSSFAAEIDSECIYDTGRSIPWKRYLVQILADHYGCARYNSSTYPNGRMHTNIFLIGKKSDMEITRYMFSWLNLEIERLCKINCKGTGKINCQSYCLGAVEGIKIQLDMAKQQVKIESTTNQSSALVKLDERKSDAEKALETLVPNLRRQKVASKSYITHEGYNSGIAAGKNINLNKSLNSGSNKLIGD